MATGRHDEDSEYHFSDTDEEVSYEVETEISKPAPAAEKAGNLLANLSRSKRMLISIVVFLVLLFIVYKVVAPSNSTPSTEIKAPPVTAAIEPKRITPPAMSAPVTTVVNSPVSQQPAAPLQQQVPVQPPTQQAIVTQPAAVSPPLASAPPQALATMPTVIPVQSSPTAQAPVNNTISAMQSDSEKLMAQMQSVYLQKINEYATQNKALQDQVQILNTRVANVETQLNQLVQALTRQGQGAPPNDAIPATAAPSVEAAAKAAYDVQAIIPGRAWLRSDNGETVTVAEGDVIKDLGRVTKIDPYDGVVQINTGTKMISLSYGNGG